jgi:hypothetical protein
VHNVWSQTGPKIPCPASDGTRTALVHGRPSAVERQQLISPWTFRGGWKACGVTSAPPPPRRRLYFVSLICSEQRVSRLSSCQTMRGRRIRSATMIADAKHLSLDVVGRSDTWAERRGAQRGWWANVAVGVIVTGFICHVGWQVSVTSDIPLHDLGARAARRLHTSVGS